MWMHRAGVDRACRDCMIVGGVLIQILDGVRHKLGVAPSRAKIIRLSCMRCSVLGCMGINIHAADGVFDQIFRSLIAARFIMLMCAMIGFLRRFLVFHFVSLSRSFAAIVSSSRLHGALFVSVIGRLLSGPAAALGVCGFYEGRFMVALFMKFRCPMMCFGCGLMIFSGFGMTGARHGDLLHFITFLGIATTLQPSHSFHLITRMHLPHGGI
ncbi:membrane protein of unknown function [Hyphomicrobium sp. 1Nfss2.1]